MQGYVLEVKKYIFLLLIFCVLQLYHALFWMDVARSFFPHHTKKNCSTLQNHHFSDPDAQRSEDHGPVPLLEYTQGCKEPCDSMNNKSQLYYHTFPHTSHMMLQAKQAEQLN